MRETGNTQKKRNARSAVVVGLLLLLAAVIGFGGYTLAKYVSSKQDAGSANVAKWGFTVTADSTSLFGDKYKKGTDASVVTTDADATFTVKATSAGTNVVAPGTTGSMTFAVKGTAEVRAQINLEFTVTNDVKLVYTAGGAEQTYAPVKWTLKKGGTALVTDGTLADVEEKLNADDVKTVTYEAGATAVNDEYTLSWAWAFDDNDELDTLLGMVANNDSVDGAFVNGNSTAVTGDGKTSTSIGFTLNISVTQLAE